jgi:hypothetical protein
MSRVRESFLIKEIISYVVLNLGICGVPLIQNPGCLFAMNINVRGLLSWLGILGRDRGRRSPLAGMDTNIYEAGVNEVTFELGG